MKKQYVTPVTSVMTINTPEMICTSTSVIGFNLNEEDETDDNFAREIAWPDSWDE